MNSATWFVTAGGRDYVAKAVTGSVITPGDPVLWFRGGLAVADALAVRGFPSGAPVRTTDGELAVPFGDGGLLALLTFVGSAAPAHREIGGVAAQDQREIGGVAAQDHREIGGMAAQDQREIGARLGEVHRLLRGVTVDGEVGMDWVDPGAAHLGLRPWLRDAVAGAVRDLAVAGPLTHGLLHADPAPEAFIGGGLIDWGVALRGPLVYDVASAVMYLGGPGGATAFLDAYGAGGTVPGEELQRALPALLRFRYAVQADYFARRIAVGDLTGIASGAENEQGLDDARRALTQPHHQPHR